MFFKCPCWPNHNKTRDEYCYVPVLREIWFNPHIYSATSFFLFVRRKRNKKYKNNGIKYQCQYDFINVACMIRYSNQNSNVSVPNWLFCGKHCIVKAHICSLQLQHRNIQTYSSEHFESNKSLRRFSAKKHTHVRRTCLLKYFITPNNKCDRTEQHIRRHMERDSEPYWEFPPS